MTPIPSTSNHSMLEYSKDLIKQGHVHLAQHCLDKLQQSSPSDQKVRNVARFLNRVQTYEEKPSIQVGKKPQEKEFPLLSNVVELINKGRFDLALLPLEKFLKEHPDHTQAREVWIDLFLGRIEESMKKKEFDHANNDFKMLYRKYPNNKKIENRYKQALDQKIEQYISEKKFGDALISCRKFLRFYPKNSDVLNLHWLIRDFTRLDRKILCTEDFHGALKICNAFLERFPRNPDALYYKVALQSSPESLGYELVAEKIDNKDPLRSACIRNAMLKLSPNLTNHC